MAKARVLSLRGGGVPSHPKGSRVGQVPQSARERRRGNTFDFVNVLRSPYLVFGRDVGRATNGDVRTSDVATTCPQQKDRRDRYFVFNEKSPRVSLSRLSPLSVAVHLHLDSRISRDSRVT